jgi:hypothetical protein
MKMLLLHLVSLVLSCSGLIRLWVSARQNPLACFFRSHSWLIKQSDDILNRVASLAGLTKEQPHLSCFLSQLVGVHLLERIFPLFLVAHRRAYTD